MSLKKIFCGLLAAAMIFSASTLCTAADDSANAKLARIEIDTYGAEQVGAILDRISRLEKSYSGQSTSGNMNARIDAIYKILYDNTAQPCILAKVNALEWNINHEVKSGGVERRLVDLEMAILGKVTEGTFNTRIRALAKSSFGEEILPITKVQVPVNTLIKVETLAPASSKTMQAGDSIPVRVVEDIFVDGALVFVTGLPGEGTVVNVHRARNIMSNGKIEVDFHTLQTVDGQSATTFSGVESRDEMKAQQMGRGLSLVGITFSGKTAGMEEVFMRGKNVDLPAGVQLYVQTKEPIVVYGVTTSGGGMSIAEPTQPTQPITPTQPVNEPRPIDEPIQSVNEPQPVDEPTVDEPTQPTVQQPVQQPRPTTQPKPSVETQEPGTLSDDEKIAVAPEVPPEPVKQPEPAPKPAPVKEPAPAADDGEIIEIFDEE